MRARKFLLLIFLVCASGVGCVRTSPEIVKIGLVAPFEGRYREIGYDVIPSARLAVREFNQLYSDSNIVVEIVAYDDLGDTDRAQLQATRLASDDQVVAVLGHWLSESTVSAIPVYAEQGITVYTALPEEILLGQTDEGWVTVGPSLASYEAALGEPIQVASTLDPEQSSSSVGGLTQGMSQFWLLNQSEVRFASPYYLIDDAPPGSSVSGSPSEFVAGFQEGSGGQPPGLYSALAYELTWVALSDVAHANDLDPLPVPANDMNTMIYLYQWQEGERVLLEALTVE